MNTPSRLITCIANGAQIPPNWQVNGTTTAQGEQSENNGPVIKKVSEFVINLVN
jgi:hypothetical protein